MRSPRTLRLRDPITMTDTLKCEVLLHVGAEGGSVKLYGVRTSDGWLYQKDVVDQTPLMLDEQEIRHSSAFTSSWKEALELLDRNRWQRLSPIRVHPEFRQAIWAAVQQRYTGENPEQDLERWRDRCGIVA